MRIQIVFFLVLSWYSTAIGTNIKQDREKYNIVISITRTESYCGGARPSPELIRELETPKPLPGKKIYLKKGVKNSFNTKIYKELTTDSLGKVRVLLPPGNYFIVDGPKKDTSWYNQLIRNHSVATKNYSKIDKLCLKEWYEQPELTFVADSFKIMELNVNFHRKCSWNEIPCIEFKGPKPQ